MRLLKPIQFRLSPETIADLDRIRESRGLTSLAETLRQLVHEAARKIPKNSKERD